MPNNSPPEINGTYYICTLDTCPIDWAYVKYVPTLPGNAIYLSIMVVLLLAQLYLGIRHRTWGFLAGMTGGLILEVLGYGGRVMMHSNPFDFNAFLLYLICLTIGPAFLAAAIYVCLARIIIVYGATLSRFQPRTYTITFVSCDFVSLVLQSIGGGITSTANDGPTSDMGVHIMVAGLAFQVFSLVLFMCLCLDFAFCVRRCPVEGRDGRFAALRDGTMFRGFQVALAIATVMIFVRSVYRVAELQGGFGGSIANNQTLFLIFEGPMIIIAVGVLTIFHPGTSFGGAWSTAAWSLRKKVESG